jgi:single-stranded-DNA-specific exonuclease
MGAAVCYADHMEQLSLTGKKWDVRRDLRPLIAGHQALEQKILPLLLEERGLLNVSQTHLPMTAEEDIPPDLEKAIERTARAIASKETVGIFGDYDCDGITAVAQLSRLLTRHGLHPVTRLPHRLHEGYGLRQASIAAMHDQGVTLLFTVDTGVTALEEITAAVQRGMDVIILDHHHLPPVLPPAHAILHPLLTRNPLSPPAAAGIVYGFIAAMEQSLGNGSWEGQETDLAMAAIGTVADLVELKGCNRSLVREGIDALNRLTKGPLATLCANAGITLPLTSRDIAFRLAPRLNAAGRMADPAIALQGLLGDTPSLLLLEQLNLERQTQVRSIVEQVTLQAKAVSKPFLSFADTSYSAGIVGLIAGKLTETFGKPSMVAQVQGDICVASLRSIPGFNITEALHACKDLLLNFGGHAQAAGCTVTSANFSALTHRLTQLAEEAFGGVVPRAALSIDGILNADHITLRLCNGISQLEPFGQGNSEPRFLLENVRLTSIRRVGKDGAHLQARVGALKSVGFHLGHLAKAMEEPLDVACRLSVDTWNGAMQPQLLLEDVRASQKIATLAYDKHQEQSPIRP